MFSVKQLAFRHRALCCAIVWLAWALAFVTGCTSPDESKGPAGEQGEKTSGLAGAEVKLIVVGDHSLAEAVRLLRGEWQGSTGAKLEISQQSVEELLSQDKLSADALIYPAEYLGELAERKWLAPIPSNVLNDPLLAWDEIFEADKSRIAAWGTEAYGVPFGAPALTCCYRADLLKKLNRKPPETWAEYQELVELFSDRQKLGDAGPAAGAPWFAAAEPLDERWAGLTLLARAAAYAKHHNHYSTLFDMQSMAPLVAGPPFVRALDELTATAKHSAKSSLEFGPREVRRALADGQCALALVWLAPARSRGAGGGKEDAKNPAAPALHLGFSVLPGASEAYNLATKAWDKREKSEAVGVPLLAVAGRLGSIAKDSSSGEAAGQLLAWLSGPKWGPRVSTTSTDVTLYRESQLAAPSEWVDVPVEEPAALQYAESVKQALSREETLMALRIPGRDRYLAALNAAVRQAVAGEASSQEALDRAAEEWGKITAELGVDAQRAAYHRDLGLR